MREAESAFLAELKRMPLRPLACPVALNATGGDTRSLDAVVSALASQLRSTVEWGACMTAIAERRPACVLEIGGGCKLARMWNARHGDIPARSLEEFRAPGGVSEWFARLQ